MSPPAEPRDVKANVFVYSYLFFSVHRHSPCPVRRPGNANKESKAPNNRLSVAVRAQQRHSPRGANGDKSKPSKGKERKEVKEGRAKDDKVHTAPSSSLHCLTCSQYLHCGSHSIHMLLVCLFPGRNSSFLSGRKQTQWLTFRLQSKKE